MALTFDAVCTIVSAVVFLISNVLEKWREYTMLAHSRELSIAQRRASIGPDPS